jgi:hypothetical protein
MQNSFEMCCLQLCTLQLFKIHLLKIEIFTDKLYGTYHLGLPYHIQNKYQKIITKVTYQKLSLQSNIISQPTDYASQ